MFERLESILSSLQALVEGFDASGLDRARSLELYQELSRGERMIHAAKALADALLEMARHDRTAGDAPLQPAPRAQIHVRVDYEAMMRGYTLPGEICEVPGVGPISVAEANAMLGDAIVTAVVMDNTDIRNVVRMAGSSRPSWRPP